MKYYQINIESKSKKYLEKFLIFFSKSLKNYNLINKFIAHKKKRKILTILKSPHVNKRAQEQFQINIYSKTINLYSAQDTIALLFIKKISSIVFSNVKIQIKFSINSNLLKKNQTKILNPTNFKLNFFSNESYLNEIKRENNKNILTKLKKEKIKNTLLGLKKEKIKNILLFIQKYKENNESLVTLLKKKSKNILAKLKKLKIKNTLLQNKRKKTISILTKFKEKDLKKIKQLFELIDIYGELTNLKLIY